MVHHMVFYRLSHVSCLQVQRLITETAVLLISGPLILLALGHLCHNRQR